jgi:hypothetical protein
LFKDSCHFSLENSEMLFYRNAKLSCFK